MNRNRRGQEKPGKINKPKRIIIRKRSIPGYSGKRG